MKYKKPIPKVKEEPTLSKIKKKYKKPILKNKKILDMVVKEYKDSLSDSFIEEKPPKKLKIPKIMDKEQIIPEKIITKQLKIPQTNMLEVFIVCFGNLYNKVFINE